MNNATNNKKDLDDLYYQIYRIISKYKEWVEPSSYLSEKDGYVITKYDDNVSVIFNMTYPYELSFTPIISEGYKYDINVSSNYFNDDINYTQLSTFLHGLIYGLCVVENELPDDVY